MAVIEYDPPERFVVGTVGEPGQRQFYLQATAGRRQTTVAIEKTQVRILADRINDLLDAFGGTEGSDTGAGDLTDNDPLDMPVTEEFRVGTMALALDAQRSAVVVECHAMGDSYDSPSVLQELEAGMEIDPADDPTQLVLRVILPTSTAREFARRSAAVVAAGRPPCPFCANPLDPQGHICPRANGYRR